jgi:FMN phosphatase YigB (HAD superfamily)
MFILDFDDTLFDTQKYKCARQKSLENIGVSEEIFWKTYKLVRKNEHGEMVYSDIRHAEALVHFGFEVEKVMEQFENINNELEKFVFADTHYFLESLKKSGETLLLLSLGDPRIQEMKVKGSGIHDYFERTFFVMDSKVHMVQHILEHHKPEQVWFINDKVQETQEVVSSFPNIKVVLHQSPAIPPEEYTHSTLAYFQTLTEILSYVKQ